MAKITEKPFLIKGLIMHHRSFPKVNSFRYKSTYISFPLSKLEELNKTLFSRNKFNLFGFYDSDYGNKKGGDLRLHLNQILAEYNINNVAEIVLVTHPRVLGYVFNPVSFWLCFDAKDNLIAVLSEVNNTCGQRHNYLCFKDNLRPIAASDWLEAKKEFYVSPFMKIEGDYRFRFELQDQELSFFINYIVAKKLKLSTSLKCDFVDFNNKSLLLSFLAIPFVTIKTVVLIHYQALKLYLKSIRYYKCPKDLEVNLTIGKNE